MVFYGSAAHKLYLRLISTSEDGGDNGGQETPSVDAQVEDGEEGLPLLALPTDGERRRRVAALWHGCCATPHVIFDQFQSECRW